MVFPSPENYTPVLKQYLEQRSKTGDAILLFRLGDFYECFFDDAELLARELEITLTARPDSGHPDGKVPMAGIPYRTADSYIGKLLKAGIKVAISEQVGDSVDAKGPMKREVVRILTPGTLIESQYIETERANYLASICPKKSKSSLWGLAFVDVSTGKVFVSELESSQLVLELNRLCPSELLAPTIKIKDPEGFYLERAALPTELHQAEFVITPRPMNFFDLEESKRKLRERLGQHSLEGFGVAAIDSGLQALGGILEYLEYAHPECLKSLESISLYQPSEFVQIDQQTIKNLELFENSRQGGKKGTLIELLESEISTKMGARRMREWLAFPLLSVQETTKRLNVIELLTENESLITNLRGLLSQVADLERLNAKLRSSRINPRELGWLKSSLTVVPALSQLLGELKAEAEQKSLNVADYFSLSFSQELVLKVRELDQALLDELPVLLGDGGIFKAGYSEKLDELNSVVEQNELWVRNYEETEREKTGIKSLKVSFNKAAGFYIEITKANKNTLPDGYKIKQNLTNVDRYLTEELKDHEAKFILAESGLKSIEAELYTFLRESVVRFCDEIKTIANQLAKIDCLCALGELSLKGNYTKPSVCESSEIKIVNGRHPVLESLMPQGSFVGNDLELTANSDGITQVMILTGPNMSGKSTFMKQNALLCIMAQMGSFIPADSAQIGIVDKVFTRIGASDDISKGQSTFMVEMTETAYLVNNLTEKSLILLDEIGRGTSTYDGMAIAWAVAEYLANKGPRTIFATHYHELNSLEDLFKSVKNYQVCVHEGENELIFLHKVVQGGADRSYGIEVARMAGLPRQIINRAQGIMAQMSRRDLPTKRKVLVKESALQAKLEFDAIF
jgi:DNA mismatch repair protein MutS